METVTMWHYHSTLDCGHRFWFDLARNLFVEGMIADPEADVTVKVTCPACHRRVIASQLAVTTERDVCRTCGKDYTNQGEGRGIMSP